jgi:type IV secretion system protein VirB4
MLTTTKDSIGGNKRRSGFQFDEEIGEEESCQQFIPYECQIDDNTIALKEGEYIQIIEIKGIPYKSVAHDKLNKSTDRLNLVLRSIADPRTTIWHTALKRKTPTSITNTQTDTFSKSFFEDYQNNLASKHLLETKHYITVIVRNPNNLTLNILEKFAILFEKSSGKDESSIRTAKLRELEKAVSKIKSGLKDYSPRLLGVYKKNGITISEAQSFLYRLINGHDAEVRLTDNIIRKLLPTSRPFFKRSSGSLIHHKKGKKFFASLSIKEFGCKETTSDSFDDLLELPFEFVYTQTFEFTTRDESIEALERQQRSLSGTDDRGFTDIDDLDDAMDEVASRKSVFGLSTISLIVFSDNERQLKDNMELADSALSKPNLMTIRDDVILEAKWWTQLPGNFKYRTRICRISSANFACFSSFHNDIVPPIKEGRWGSPMFIAQSVSHSPYPIDLHIGQRGNATVIGETGSGKTVLMVLMALALSKYTGRFFYFDKDRGAEIAIRACGGSYLVMRPGYSTGFNPCQLPKNPENEKFLERLVTTMVQEEGRPLGAKDKKIISEVVRANFEFSPEMRRLRYLEGLFPSGDDDDLKTRFSMWINDGPNAWLFDNPEDSISIDTQGVGFDLTNILDEPEVRAPALAYMTHRIKEFLNGTPVAVIIDEGWKALGDTIFSEDIKDWAKTIRKKEGVMIFGSNAARDLANSPVGLEVIDQAVTRFFGYNPKAKSQDYQKGFSLTDEEFATVKALDEYQFLVKKGNYSNVITIPLDGMDEHLKVISGTEATVNNLDNIRSKYGDDPDKWLPIFNSALSN